LRASVLMRRNVNTHSGLNLSENERMNTHHETLRVLVAIDFGQTGSGYSWVFFGDGVVNYNTKWPNPILPLQHKTRTALLYNRDGFVDWGDSGVKQSWNQLERVNSGYRLVKNFKLHLHNGVRSAEGPLARGKKQQYPVVNWVTDYLRCIKKCALDNIRQTVTGDLDERQVFWCLTVPAIWTPEDKHWMRIAAQRAGLIRPDDADAGRLCMVPEPEAAALYCQRKESCTGIDNLRPGSCYMVVDAGGGTVDIIVHSVLPEGGVEEVVKGDGGDCGSTAINAEFWMLLRKRFGDKALVHFKDKKPVALMELLSNFEEVKCRYSPAQYGHDKAVYVLIPVALVEILRVEFPDVYGRLTEKKGFLRDIEITRAGMEKLFAGVLERIVELVRKHFDRLDVLKRDCDYIFLVGGFAASPLLQERLQKEFKDRVKKIVTPTNPGVAVMQGAAYYGLNPSERVKFRKARMSFGFQLSLPFEPGEDIELHKGKGEESERCPRRFWPLVKVGDTLSSDKPFSQKLSPVFPDRETGILPVYQSPRNGVRYTDEEGVQCLGQLEVPMPSDNTEVEVSMSFGQTEFFVTARNLGTGKAVAVNFRYIHETSTSPFTVG
jgi:molecular chaperone DnaK (HSP70)